MALPELPQSRYATAAATRARTIGDIALDKYDAGSAGVMGSYAQAAKEKMAASSMRMKERFDPLNMVQGLTGSRLLTTAAGRMMGRKSEDIDYFRDKATQRDTARNPGGYQDIAASAKNRVESESQKKLLESQTKINNLVLTGRTTLYPKEDIVDGLNDLYDLIDARMPVGGAGSYGSRAGQESQAAASPVTAGGGGSSLGDLGMSVAGNLGKKALKTGGRFAMQAARGAVAYGAQALGTAAVAEGALALGGTAVVAAPVILAGLAGRDERLTDDATPKPVPDEVTKNKKFGYLKDLTSYDPTPYLDLNYGNGSGQDAEQLSAAGDQFIKSLINKVPEDDRVAFGKMLEKQVLPFKDPNEKMAALADFINRYSSEKINSPDKPYAIPGSVEQVRAERVDTSNIATNANAAVPKSYGNDVLRFQRDQKAAAKGDAIAIARLKAAGVDAEGKPLQSTQTVAAVPAVENNMNNLEQARAAASTQQAAAPVIINAGGGGQTQMPSSQAAPAIPPPGTATTNSSVNRFEDKLMGGNADYLP